MVYIPPTKGSDLKAHNHLHNFESLKPSRFGDISLLVFKISKEAAMFGPKNTMFILQILILIF